MNRREFLFLRTERRRRVAEVSCERLYMRYVDSHLAANLGEEAFPVEQPWMGEPPAVFERLSIRELFANLDRALRFVDVLRVSESRWIAAGELRAEFERVLASFRSHGGQVEFQDAQVPQTRTAVDADMGWPERNTNLVSMAKQTPCPSTLRGVVHGTNEEE